MSDHALDAATGTPLWTSATGHEVFAAPELANGQVYDGADGGHVYAFGLARGLITRTRPNRNSLHPDYNLPRSDNPPQQDRRARTRLARLRADDPRAPGTRHRLSY